MKRTNNKGFTIIELLISTVIFSVIILVVTSAIVQIGRIYYKGVLQSRTQERTRGIIEDISQTIQVGRPTDVLGVSGSPGTKCIGSKKYTYQTNKQVNSTQRVLVSQPYAGDCSYDSNILNAASPLPLDAVEMVGENMQLLSFGITRQAATTNRTDLYSINVRLAYGKSSDIVAGKCRTIRLGGQFCAVSELTTTVSSRFK